MFGGGGGVVVCTSVRVQLGVVCEIVKCSILLLLLLGGRQMCENNIWPDSVFSAFLNLTNPVCKARTRLWVVRLFCMTRARYTWHYNKLLLNSLNNYPMTSLFLIH
jgi:hypothetical protein